MIHKNLKESKIYIYIYVYLFRKKKKIVGKKKEKAKEMKEDELIDQKLKGEEEVSNEESKEYAFHCFKITINVFTDK